MSSEKILASRQAAHQDRVAAVEARAPRYIERRSEAPFLWDIVLFGYSISGNVLTVRAGEIHYAKSIVAIAETPVTIGADDTYVAVRMVWLSGSATIVSGAAKQQTDDQYFYKWLFKVGLSGGNAYIKEIGHCGGAIVLMAAYAQNA